MSAKSSSRYDVFISHARQDSGAARELAAALREAGRRPWLDLDEVHAGDRLSERISDGIRSSQAIVLLISHDSLDSQWVSREWAAALTGSFERTTRIIPVRLDNAPIPAFIAHVLIADARDQDFARVAKEIEAILERDHAEPLARSDQAGSVRFDAGRLARLEEIKIAAQSPDYATDGFVDPANPLNERD